MFWIPAILGTGAIVGASNWLAGAARGEGTTPLGTYIDMKKEEWKEDLSDFGEAAQEEITDALIEAAETAAEVIVPVTVGMAEAFVDEVRGAIRKRTQGHEDSVVMYLMLSLMTVTVLLFVWRTAGRRRKMV